MKKTIFILTAMFILMLCLTSCGDDNDTANMCQHTYVESIAEEPTCDYGGHKLFTCTQCGDEYIDYYSIPPLEHDYVESVYNEPSCGRYGEGDKKFTCTQCGDEYIDYGSIPALEHEWTQATCTSAKKCTRCGETEGYSLGHKISESDGTCTTCGFGVKFILPTTPMTISNTSGYDQTCKIESIKIERIQKYSTSTPYYELTFIVQRTYHEKGNNYSDSAKFGWKLYDEDGLVVASGTGYTDGSIKVGEKSKETITFYIGEDRYIQDGETYRLELLNIS